MWPKYLITFLNQNCLKRFCLDCIFYKGASTSLLFLTLERWAIINGTAFLIREFPNGNNPIGVMWCLAGEKRPKLGYESEEQPESGSDSGSDSGSMDPNSLGNTLWGHCSVTVVDWKSYKEGLDVIGQGLRSFSQLTFQRMTAKTLKMKQVKVNQKKVKVLFRALS